MAGDGQNTDGSTDPSGADPNAGGTAPATGTGASPDPNNPSPDGGWFTDTAALSDSMNDGKVGDTIVVSQIPDAQAIINQFLQSTATNPWTNLDRQAVGNRLNAIVANSRLIKQGNLNLCGPAAFMICWVKRDPVAFANYATALFNNGSSSIGTMTVTPSSGMLAQDYSAIATTTGTEMADWLVLGALKDTNEFFWQGTWNGDPTQNIAGMTLPSQMVDWFNATGIYQSVNNQANLATSAGIPQASSILNANGQDVALLIHLNLLTGVLQTTDSDGWLLRQFPNHWIVLLSEITQEATASGPGPVDLSFWTWGETHLSMDNTTTPPTHLIQVAQDRFIQYYYGSITATMKSA